MTSLSNGYSTTTYSYDNDGNLISAGNGTATTTYTYDYANHLTAIFCNGATTSFGYDAFGARVYQIASTTATTTYPFKFFCMASTTKSGANYATSTEYIFNGDTLLSTVDQAFKNGAATGTAAVRYVHPDHLGSTNVVTDANQNLVQTLDYYPYGATRISNSTSTNEKRKFIGQFSDDTGLSYLNARYYSPTQGQFISQDPVFWEIGLSQDGKSAMLNPQALNSYGYANDNPITNKDPLGRYLELSGSLVAPGRAWSAGIRFDSNGIDYFFSGGVGGGLEAGFEAMWAPGVKLAHTNQASVSVNGTVADGIGGGVSANIWTYDPVTKKAVKNDAALGVVIGAGTGGGVQFEESAPVPYLVWNKPFAQGKLGSTANVPATIMSYKTYMSSQNTSSQYVVQNNTTYLRTSGGGLAPTALPATVTQGGATYYRNSSGLLSTKPGL
jgi:RHS repeat-associated protein